ncbi:MAG: hypothetical protein IJZ84_05990, partial [Lachnospiraceae bacterium]|nr:hypothetical protein [Lachnospiraceae bacterium]
DTKVTKDENMPVYDKAKLSEEQANLLKQLAAKEQEPAKPAVKPFVIDFGVSENQTVAEPTLKETYQAKSSVPETQKTGVEEMHQPQAYAAEVQKSPLAERYSVKTPVAEKTANYIKPMAQIPLQTEQLEPLVPDYTESSQMKPIAANINTVSSQTKPMAADINTVIGNLDPLSHVQITDVKQETLFEEQFLSEKAKESYEILGQVFGTYWIVAYSDRMYMIDQHAAHEKVKYERLVAAVRAKDIVVQNIMPPVVLQTSAKEEQVVLEHMDAFLQLGFEIEEFGDHTFCLRAVPVDLFGCSYQELFREVLDELMEGPVTGTPEVVLNKLASMACKAAVKGNTRLNREEAVKLIDELLTLENPYHCPHGRPTIISMTKQEMEKKFKRIV